MMQPATDGIALGGLPLSIDGERPALRNVAPELGANTEDFFARAGKT